MPALHKETPVSKQNLGDHEQRFRDTVQLLDAAHMQTMIEHYRSGGVRSPNWDGTSRGTTGSRVLQNDPIDARGYQDIAQTIKDLKAASELLERIDRRQQWWARITERLPDPPSQACENCTKPCDPLNREDRLRALTLQHLTRFVCTACYAHGRRRGTWRKTASADGRTSQA